MVKLQGRHSHIEHNLLLVPTSAALSALSLMLHFKLGRLDASVKFHEAIFSSLLPELLFEASRIDCLPLWKSRERQREGEQTRGQNETQVDWQYHSRPRLEPLCLL